MAIKGKKILLCISGSIAAYKCVSLIRLLKKEGAEVRIIATTSALDFVGATTLATLSENPVCSQMLLDKTGGTWQNHVALGLWADLFLVVFATANTLAKMAHGIADNLLITTYLSARCPVWIAPAMDLDMYQHPSTQANLALLQKHGVKILEANSGALASGLEGKGRMQEPEEIHAQICAFFSKSNLFLNQKVLITAGPTQEALDPVRYISNHSSGKMGCALAESFAQNGAWVDLVIGPLKISPPTHQQIKTFPVCSAQEMFEQTAALFQQADIIVFAAAVADYRVESIATQKIKKSGNTMNLTLVKNIDIAATLSPQKHKGQISVGFALETENELFNAQQKRQKKAFDLLVLNSLNDAGAGFGHETNKVSLLTENEQIDLELMPKKDVAQKIVQYISTLKKSL